MVGSKTFVAAVAVVFCLCGVASALRHITSMDDFFSFANDVANLNLKDDVILDIDLDFAKAPLLSPVGATSDNNCAFLSRDFDGNGHVVKNLTMDNRANKKGAALFCGVFYSTVKNLAFDDSCEFIGTTAATVAVYGISPVISNVLVNAKVTGISIAGGFIGQIENHNETFLPASTTHIERCENNAVVKILPDQNGYAGGFIGSVNCHESSLQFSVFIENNYGEYNIYAQGSDAVLGDLIGSMEKSVNGHLSLKGNKITATSHTGQCKAVYTGGPIGRITSSPNFAIDMEFNSYHHVDKDN